MNMNLIDINLDIIKNISSKENKVPKKDDKFDKVLDNKKIKNKDYNKDSEREYFDDEDNNQNIKELEELYLYLIQSFNKLESDKLKELLLSKEISLENMQKLKEVLQNQEILKVKELVESNKLIDVDEQLITNKASIENIDIQYLNNLQDNILQKNDEIDCLDFKILNQELLENTSDNTNRIEQSNELDLLGKISMLDSKNTFDKSSIFNNGLSEMNNLPQENIENKVNQEVIKNINFMKTEDIKELSIKLRPRELGDMHIKLIQENDTLKAIVSVGEKDIYNMLNKNISELKNHLELFNVKEISIVIESDNNYSSDTFDKNFEQHQNRSYEENLNKRNRKNIIENIEKEEENFLQEGINLLA